MKFLQYITERSFDQVDIPRYFRCVIDISKYNERGASDVAKMELTGVTGISDSGQIVYDFLGKGRNALLLMDGKETSNLNKLSKVMYDNPHYMLSNNMSGLRRIYSKERDHDHNGTWHNLADMIFKNMVKNNLFDAHYITFNVPGQTVATTKVARDSKVNSIKDAVKVFKRALQDGSKKNYDYKNMFNPLLTIPDSKFEKIIYDTLIDVGKIYQTEGEWIIKDKSLKIPKNSFLYILLRVDEKIVQDYDKGEIDPFMEMRFGKDIEEQKKMMDDLEKLGIMKNYRVKFLSEEKWEQIYKKYIDRRYS